jgi:coproporphyrinogen III oxidase-like Fe-S oxidoreductase
VGRLNEDSSNSELRTSNSELPLGLYLHIPFCSAICGYCNFNRGLLDPDLKRRYVEALEREIQAAQPIREERASPATRTRSFSAAARRRCSSLKKSAG